MTDTRFDPNQPRDPDGKWSGGMPSVISAVDVTVGGTTGSMSAVAGDKVRVSLGGGTADIPSTTGRRLLADLAFKGDRTIEVPGDDGKPEMRVRLGRHVEDVEDDFGGGAAAQVEFVRQGKTVNLSAAEVRKFAAAYERASASSRVETVSGPVDTFLDGKRFAIRTKVANSDPAALSFSSRDWERIRAAHEAIQEGFDDAGDYGPTGADLNTLTVKTGSGDIVVSRRNDGGDSTISISAAARDDWFVTHRLDSSDPFYDAINRMEEAADALGFYVRGATVKVYRAIGFVDRTSMAVDRPLRVIMASEGRKADGIDLRMAGARLDRYRSNPVLGYGHSYMGRDNLPIGRVNPGSMAIEDNMLAGDIEFDQDDEFALKVERKMRAGYLNAVSVGFEVTDWEPGARGVASGWELTELSVVPVPMDASALVTAGRADLDDDEVANLIRRLEEALRRDRGPLVLPQYPEVRPTRNDPEPPAQEIDQIAARDLLAAFAPKEIG